MRRQSRWSRSAPWRQGVVALAVLFAGLLQAMDQYHIWKNWGWGHSDNTLFWSTAAAGALALLNTVGDALSQRRDLYRSDRRFDTHQAVLGVLASISVKTGIVITDLGANVFRARRWFGYRSKTIGNRTLYLGRRPRLERYERVRLSEYPMRSGVRWTEGKGVIGACWEHGRPEYVHWAPLARKWSEKDITDQEWAAIPDKDKVGFTRKEFMEMASKYAEIKAVPIKDDRGKVIGVLAVDRVWSREDRAQWLNSRSVEETITQASSVLQNVLGKG